MRPSEQVPRAAVVTAVAAVLGVGVLLSVVAASLYGDGAAMLVEALRSGGTSGLGRRWLINDVRGVPVFLFLRLGVSNTHLLGVAQTFGFVGFASIAWAAAIILARWRMTLFSFVVLAAGFCMGTLASFGASELLLGLAVVAVLTVLLARPRPWTWPEGLAAVLASLLVVVAHEGLIACALIWGIHAASRAIRAAGTAERVAAVVVACAAVACIVWGLTTLAGLPAGSSGGFIAPLQQVRPASAPLLLAGGVCLGIVAIARRPLPVVARVPLIVAGAVCTVLAIVLALRLGPGASYLARTWCVLAMVLMQVVVLTGWARRWPSRDEGRSSVLLVLPVGFLVAALVIPVGNAVLWQLGLAQVRTAVTTGTGLLSQDGLPELGQRALYSWTNPYLSILVRAGTDDAVIVDPHREREAWVPPPIGSAEQAQRMIPPQFTWR